MPDRDQIKTRLRGRICSEIETVPAAITQFSFQEHPPEGQEMQLDAEMKLEDGTRFTVVAEYDGSWDSIDIISVRRLA